MLFSSSFSCCFLLSFISQKLCHCWCYFCSSLSSHLSVSTSRDAKILQPWPAMKSSPLFRDLNWNQGTLVRCGPETPGPLGGKRKFLSDCEIHSFLKEIKLLMRTKLKNQHNHLNWSRLEHLRIVRLYSLFSYFLSFFLSFFSRRTAILLRNCSDGWMAGWIDEELDCARVYLWRLIIRFWAAFSAHSISEKFQSTHQTNQNVQAWQISFSVWVC